MSGPPPVMVVDDDESLREGLLEYLEMQGFAPRGAVDGIDALEQLAGEPLPAVIVLDLMMPRMNGIDFREHQKKDARLAGIPLIVVTARHDGRRQAEQMGAAGYFAKPINLDRLMETVHRLCAQG